MKTSRSWLVLAALAMILLPRVGWSALALKADDRIVIYGDSITEQRIYSRYLQQYLYCRYPELKLKFFNAGWGGDTAVGALNRLERDVLVLPAETSFDEFLARPELAGKMQLVVVTRDNRIIGVREIKINVIKLLAVDKGVYAFY